MVGLILEGCAMRAVFVTGAVMALMDKGLTDFGMAWQCRQAYQR